MQPEKEAGTVEPYGAPPSRLALMQLYKFYCHMYLVLVLVYVPLYCWILWFLDL